MEIQNKNCSKCLKDKPLNEFYKDKNSNDGYTYTCRKCRMDYLFEHKKEFKIYVDNWYIKHREKVLKQNKIRYDKNKKTIAEKGKIYRQKHPEKVKHHSLMGKYNISYDNYLSLFNLQDGRCAICNNKEIEIDQNTKKNKYLSVDHNHKTGKIRGLLCAFCNKAIGLLKDDTHILQSAIDYLNRNK